MKYELDEVYTLKLSSGEEIVAKVVVDHSDHIGVKKPLSIAYGQQGIQLMPTLVTANPDKIMRLNKNTIAINALTRNEVLDSYVEATTGIKPVSKNIIMG